jgi:transcriptional regulator with XRE-family HTH domain
VVLRQNASGRVATANPSKRIRRAPERAARDPSSDVAWRKWMTDFGRHVRRVRRFLGMSQGKLAALSRVSQGAISRFEAGRGLNTPFLSILRINLALARELKALDPSMLTDDIRRFLTHMEFLATPRPGGTPKPGGVDLERIALSPDPGLEGVIRIYRSLPESRREAFAAAAQALAAAFGH